MDDVVVRPGRPGETDAVLSDTWGGADMVVHGRVFHLPDLPRLVAVAGAEIVGVLTYEVRDTELEIVSCDSLRRGVGVGRSLVAAAAAVAREAGVAYIVCTTTNDNVGALAFWQRTGLRLDGIRSGAVDEARRVKPSIPLVGEHGIEIHDEIDLRAPVDQVADAAWPDAAGALPGLTDVRPA